MGMAAAPKPSIRITYCIQCNWLLRAGWMAQELLSSFGEALDEVAIVPGAGGIFEITCDGELIWERKRDGGFPDAAELKRRLRDLAWPDKALGHADKKPG
jgi:selenoprotein W-related protein